MRIAVLAALVLLSAGCSATTDHSSHHTSSATRTPPSRSAPTGTTPISELIAWVEAGTPADPAAYGTVRQQDGATTALQNDDRAFSTPSGKTKCMTDHEHGGQSLICLVELTDPPREPQEHRGNWVGGWVDYTGSELTVGGLHGDPGPFVRGVGAELPYGSRLDLHDYTCRLEAAGLTCVNFTANSGVQMSAAGVIPFGCLGARAVDPEENVGLAYAC